MFPNGPDASTHVLGYFLIGATASLTCWMLPYMDRDTMSGCQGACLMDLGIPHMGLSTSHGDDGSPPHWPQCSFT